jgi:hypothetical protein
LGLRGPAQIALADQFLHQSPVRRVKLNVFAPAVLLGQELG